MWHVGDNGDSVRDSNENVVAAYLDSNTNASLMAAAPDLLAALKLATQWVPTDAMFYSQKTHGERIYTKDVINQAIAKAEGKS